MVESSPDSDISLELFVINISIIITIIIIMIINAIISIIIIIDSG